MKPVFCPYGHLRLIPLGIAGEKQPLIAKTEYVYRWTLMDGEEVLFLESVAMKAELGGKVLSDSFIDREQIRNNSPGKTFEKKRTELPETVQKMFHDYFEAPLCKIRRDADGREVKRTIVAGEKARPVIDGGFLANALLFHPPFPKTKPEWESNVQVPLGTGGGGCSSGVLKYKKVDGAKTGQGVEVAGTLANESFQQPGTNIKVKNVKYDVRGKQLRDVAGNAWTSGEMKLSFSYEIEADEKVISTTSGTMQIEFTKLADAK